MFDEPAETFEDEISHERHARRAGLFVERERTHGKQEQIITRFPVQAVENLSLDWMAHHLHEKEYGAIWGAAFKRTSAATWLGAIEKRVKQMASGQQKLYALHVLREAARVTSEEPMVESTQKNGVAITVKVPGDIVSVLIEKEIGMIVRTGEHFIIRCDYDLNSSAGGEFLSRCSQEIRALERAE